MKYSDPTIKDLCNVFKYYKVPYDKDGYGKYVWDGNKINVKRLYDKSPNNLKLANAYHEVAHYLLAKKSQRKKNDFGLGNAIESEDLEKEFSYNFCMTQEMSTSYVEIYLMLKRRIPMKYIYPSVDDRTLSYLSDMEWDNIYQDLKKTLRKLKIDLNLDLIKKYKKMCIYE